MTMQHKTQNLYEAAYCLCKGLKLVGKRREGNKITVLFEGPKAKDVALKFYNKARVEAKAFTDSYRTLKDYIFES